MSGPLDEQIVELGLFKKPQEVPCFWKGVIENDRVKRETGSGTTTFDSNSRCALCGGTPSTKYADCKAYRPQKKYDGGQNEQSN